MISDNPESSKGEMSTNRNAPTPKQAVVIIFVAVVLWVPMICFIIFYGQRFSPRQIAGIGAVNLLVGVSLLVVAYRKWIRHLK
jgi:drug/metabolite transporter (DMT)-like permease